MKDVLRDSLRSVLNPKSVAVIGASENANKIGRRPDPRICPATASRARSTRSIRSVRDPRVQGLSVAGGPAGSAGSRNRGARGRRGDRRGGAVRRPWGARDGRHEFRFRGDRSRGRQGQGETHARCRPREGHARDRAELPGPGQLRQRRDPVILYDVHRGPADGRASGGGEPVRRDERGSLRPAAQPRHRRAPLACHWKRQRCHRRGTGLRGRRGPGPEVAAALSRKHHRPVFPGGDGAHRARAQPAGDRAEIRPHGGGPGSGASPIRAHWPTKTAWWMRFSQSTASGARAIPPSSSRARRCT